MHLKTPSQLTDSASSASLLKTTQWIENFLAKPHAELGRSGVVCPFVPKSLKLETMQMVEISTEGMSQSDLESLVKEYREIFLAQFPQQGKLAIYKALLLVFPDVLDDQCDVIDRVQQTLKPFFVEKGLMLGEFHRSNQSPGLHNPDFRPLRSPVPMLAIRFMTEADLPFLSRMTDSPRLRIQYLEAYLAHMAAMGESTKLIKAKRALIQARQQADAQPTSRCPVKRLGRSAKRMVAWGLLPLESLYGQLRYLLRSALPKLLGQL